MASGLLYVSILSCAVAFESQRGKLVACFIVKGLSVHTLAAGYSPSLLDTKRGCYCVTIV
jgi:hypothetical protein